MSANGQSIPYHIEVDDNVGLDHVSLKLAARLFSGCQLLIRCNLSGSGQRKLKGYGPASTDWAKLRDLAKHLRKANPQSMGTENSPFPGSQQTPFFDDCIQTCIMISSVPITTPSSITARPSSTSTSPSWRSSTLAAASGKGVSIGTICIADSWS